MSAQLITSHQTTRGRIATAVAAVVAIAAAADATTLDRVTATDRLTKADLVVETTVTGIEYRRSIARDADEVELPHAFVTFRVEHVFHGEANPAESITLRFEGGPDGRGRALKVHGVPDFEIGDHDVLFVKDNGAEICPLVGWEQGRLRVVRGELFDDAGRELWITPTGEFAFSEVAIDVSLPAYPAVAAGHDLEDAHEHHETPEPPAGSQRPDDVGFRALVDSALQDLAGRGALGVPTPFRSVDPERPFFVAALSPTSAPVSPKVASTPPFQGDHDAREAREIEDGR